MDSKRVFGSNCVRFTSTFYYLQSVTMPALLSCWGHSETQRLQATGIAVTVVTLKGTAHPFCKARLSPRDSGPATAWPHPRPAPQGTEEAAILLDFPSPAANAHFGSAPPSCCSLSQRFREVKRNFTFRN